ncbi:MAG: hypothetical protein ABIZ80_25710 [Bryobacteraceae bacterium]
MAYRFVRWTWKLLVLFSLCSCGRYAEFTLPAPESGNAPPTFTWHADLAPVLARGAAGEWDAADALNPSVIVRNGEFLNFYSGFDGRAWHTGLATSRDGTSWQKQGRLLSPDRSTWEGGYIAANGAAILHNNEFFYWYQAGMRELPRIGLARSSNGRVWRKLPGPVLPIGPRGSWDERGVGDPYVLRVDGFFYMYYLGQDRARRQRLGLARSRDGEQWEKLRSNPILELGEYGSIDENGLGEPAVWQSDGAWWMLYTGRLHNEERKLGLAQSGDGVHWRKQPAVFSGAEPWNNKVLCDPTVIVAGPTIHVWFGGGDIARPDENLHGQIGHATLSK